MKKSPLLITALILSLGILSSCGDIDADVADSTPAQTTKTTTKVTTQAVEEEPETEIDLSKLKGSLKNYDKSSFKFSTDMNVSDFASSQARNNYQDDESKVTYSIEEVNGIPMLRVQTLDLNTSNEYKIPKVRLNVTKMFEGNEYQLEKIKKIKIDVVTMAVDYFIDTDGTEKMCPGHFRGKLVSEPVDARGSSIWVDGKSFAHQQWNREWGSFEIETENPEFIDSTVAQYISIMRWAIPNDADFYIADIVFLDKDNKVIKSAYNK